MDIVRQLPILPPAWPYPSHSAPTLNPVTDSMTTTLSMSQAQQRHSQLNTYSQSELPWSELDNRAKELAVMLLRTEFWMQAKRKISIVLRYAITFNVRYVDGVDWSLGFSCLDRSEGHGPAIKPQDSSMFQKEKEIVLPRFFRTGRTFFLWGLFTERGTWWLPEYFMVSGTIPLLLLIEMASPPCEESRDFVRLIFEKRKRWQVSDMSKVNPLVVIPIIVSCFLYPLNLDLLHWRLCSVEVV